MTQSQFLAALLLFTLAGGFISPRWLRADDQPDGTVVLKAEAARIIGFQMRLEMKPTPTIVYWIDPKESIEWPRAVNKKGTYDVQLTYSCPDNAGGDFAVVAGANKLAGRTEHTPDWKTFKTVKVGTLVVLNDHSTIAIRCAGYINHVLMNVRSLTLTPVKADAQAK